VLQFWRRAGSTQAVVLQDTGAQLAAFSPLLSTFDLGNSSAGRKRISVLIHDRDFSDLSVCTFWLDGGAPMRTYAMRTRTTKAWSSATVSFYAATADGAPAYHVDNASLVYESAASPVGTDCMDPTAPPATGSGVTGNLLVNSGFTNGLAPWNVFGQIVWRIQNGVFEFYRPPGIPAGVVLQSTGRALPNDSHLFARFYLGNSSGVRKRVTVILHDADFSDLSACTFWLPPNLAINTEFGMNSFTTKPWANATLSVYGATIGTEQWIRLDFASLQHRQDIATIGTECLEPNLIALTAETATPTEPLGVEPRGPETRAASNPSVSVWRASDGFTATPDSRGDLTAWTAVARGNAPPPTLSYQLDLRAARQPHLSFESRRPDGRASAELQVSVDGVSWQTIVEVPATEDWTTIGVDLNAFAGSLIHVRFVLHPGPGSAAGTWSLAGLRIE
jgi:hypothetical protein